MSASPGEQATPAAKAGMLAAFALSTSTLAVWPVWVACGGHFPAWIPWLPALNAALQLGGDGLLVPVVANLALALAFGALHTATAQLSVQKRACSVLGLPPSFVRATFTCIAATTHLAMLLAWQAVPGRLWHLPIPAALGGEPSREIVDAVSTLALLCATSWTSLSAHGGALAFAGLPQILSGRSTVAVAQPDAACPAGKLITSGWYGWVRHPMYTLTLLACVVHSTMPAQLATYVAGLLLYLHGFGLQWEEAKLVQQFGQAYVQYQGTTPAVVPLSCGRGAGPARKAA